MANFITQNDKSNFFLFLFIIIVQKLLELFSMKIQFVSESWIVTVKIELIYPINSTWSITAYTFNLVSLYIEKSLYQKYKRNAFTWKTFLNNDPCLKKYRIDSCTVDRGQVAVIALLADAGLANGVDPFRTENKTKKC